MIDYNVCSAGFALGLFGAGVAALLNMTITALFRLMKG